MVRLPLRGLVEVELELELELMYSWARLAVRAASRRRRRGIPLRRRKEDCRERARAARAKLPAPCWVGGMRAASWLGRVFPGGVERAVVQVRGGGPMQMPGGEFRVWIEGGG